ncbi:MAG: hypothetical protein ACTMIR_04390 [Cellulomonadaceae bacterium]
MNPQLIAVMMLGGLVCACVVLAVARMLPSDVQLTDAFERMSRNRTRATTTAGASAVGTQRLGAWAMRALPPALWGKTPTKELALLRIPLTRFYTEKITFAALGLLIPPLLSTLFTVLGLRLPIIIPAAAGLGLAAVMFFIPNYNAIDDAKKARLEFRRAMSAYIDLVATERHNGSGARQAIEVPAPSRTVAPM